MAIDVSQVVSQIAEHGVAAAVVGTGVLIVAVGIKSFHLIADAMIVAKASREYYEDERDRT